MKYLFVLLIATIFFVSSCGIYSQQCEGVAINSEK